MRQRTENKGAIENLHKCMHSTREKSLHYLSVTKSFLSFSQRFQIFSLKRKHWKRKKALQNTHDKRMVGKKSPHSMEWKYGQFKKDRNVVEVHSSKMLRSVAWKFEYFLKYPHFDPYFCWKNDTGWILRNWNTFRSGRIRIFIGHFCFGTFFYIFCDIL